MCPDVFIRGCPVGTKGDKPLISVVKRDHSCPDVSARKTPLGTGDMYQRGLADGPLRACVGKSWGD